MLLTNTLLFPTTCTATHHTRLRPYLVFARRSFRRRLSSPRSVIRRDSSIITPSTTLRKRKADEADNYLSPAEEYPHKKTNHPVVTLPATPATDAGKMDSDDDFNSSMSGDDFDDQDSDLDLEEGAHTPAAAEDTC